MQEQNVDFRNDENDQSTDENNGPETRELLKRMIQGSDHNADLLYSLLCNAKVDDDSEWSWRWRYDPNIFLDAAYDIFIDVEWDNIILWDIKSNSILIDTDWNTKRRWDILSPVATRMGKENNARALRRILMLLKRKMGSDENKVTEKFCDIAREAAIGHDSPDIFIVYTMYGKAPDDVDSHLLNQVYDFFRGLVKLNAIDSLKKLLKHSKYGARCQLCDADLRMCKDLHEFYEYSSREFWSSSLFITFILQSCIMLDKVSMVTNIFRIDPNGPDQIFTHSLAEAINKCDVQRITSESRRPEDASSNYVRRDNIPSIVQSMVDRYRKHIDFNRMANIAIKYELTYTLEIAMRNGANLEYAREMLQYYRNNYTETLPESIEVIDILQSNINYFEPLNVN